MDAAHGLLKMMTIAPELPGALGVIAALDGAGVLAAIGHTAAAYDEAVAGFDAGAKIATHLFNGMPPLHHRDPGPVLAALNSGVACEVINDRIHVHPAVVRLVADHDPARLVMITDAMSAAGVGDGEYSVGGRLVTVSRGAARLAANGSLAGSTLTMDAAVRHAVIDSGLSLSDAVAAASTTPARLLGLAGERGSIAAGHRADLVHLDDDLRVVRVMQGGSWVD
jgi:N-acetylglucosamine-6-phosphate deacetylase